MALKHYDIRLDVRAIPARLQNQLTGVTPVDEARIATQEMLNDLEDDGAAKGCLYLSSSTDKFLLSFGPYLDTSDCVTMLFLHFKAFDVSG